MSFSVLMSVYFKESPVFLRQALDSVLDQSLTPGQIVLVKDGPLPQYLNDVIDTYDREHQGLFKVIPIKKNGGLGPALNMGLKHCDFDLVARMDSDDVAFRERFKEQFQYMQKNNQVSAVGGWLAEFKSIPGDLNQTRKAPQTPLQVSRFSRKRNPMNHPSVMFRKKDIQRVGGYNAVRYFEDYHLWLKLLKKGFQLANIQKELLYFRVGNDMIGRRSGYAYAKYEIRFLKRALREKLIGKSDFIKAVAIRFPLRLIPKSLLTFFYKIKLR